jgi:ribosomal protein L40E
MTASLTEALAGIVEERLADDGVVCPRCDADDLAVDVWGVADGEPRAAAECRDCDTRLNVRVEGDDIAEAHDAADSDDGG